ncbi:cytochrome P450 [Rhabdothermincola salaria]|uniref:cytochrome P450 n=1 Tax=Rhabdothermincola salaria TaxID=2903142 RepID=UPI001E2A800E|nr:cytochrome P450 [Rhabdothermincola salaria]MCD9623708.1 cytochrome P450 [Rhabdothermincola salaria]
MLSYDPHDPRWLVDGVPFDHLARIRAEQPVCPTPTGARYLSRYADVEAALKDVDTFRADLGVLSGLGGVEEVPDEQLYLSEIDEPRHGQIRRLFNATFGPHRIAAEADFVEQTCHRLVDDLVAHPPGDLHAGYALPIPGLVMAHIMGLEPEAATHFMAWSGDGRIMQRPCTPGVGDAHEPHRWFAEVLAARRADPDPPDDVFARLAGAEVEGEPLTDTEILTQLQFMVQAGVHTTRGLLTHLAGRLVAEPELFAQLRHDRALVPTFVEESLRHDAPVQRTSRRCTHAVEFAGEHFDTLDWVEMGIASANRDEAVYDDPDAFRLDRPEPRRHLAFGAGPHVCPGAALARLEGTVSVQVLLDRCRSLDAVAGATYPPVPGNLGHAPIPAVLVEDT